MNHSFKDQTAHAHTKQLSFAVLKFPTPLDILGLSDKDFLKLCQW